MGLYPAWDGMGKVARSLLLLAALAAPASADPAEEHTLVVTATAYNSLPTQTSEDPTIGAWGDSLEPGMKAIAVSRDLIPLGLTRGTRVSIEGLPGEFLVLDKMAPRWERKIDLYMGEDVEEALRWGVRTVRIHWRVKRPVASPE